MAEKDPSHPMPISQSTTNDNSKKKKRKGGKRKKKVNSGELMFQYFATSPSEENDKLNIEAEPVVS